MALSFDYANKVISVPQSDLTFVSGTFYTCDTNWLKNQILAELGSESGIWESDIYVHNTEVGPIAGTTFARTIQIINGWTIEFTPNSQWTVQLEGSNNDIWSVGDGILVQNQVQVIPTNSAGLIVGGGTGGGGVVDTYDGMVVIDTVNGVSGTASPTGTRAQPSDNITDALTIAANNGLTELYFRTDYNIVDSVDMTGFIVFADTSAIVDIQVGAGATVTSVTFRNVDLSGTMDANVTIERCILAGLNNFSGHVYTSPLYFGTINMTGDAYFIDCWSPTIEAGMPTIDMGGTGNDLTIIKYAGPIEIQNKTGPDLCNVNLNGGEVTIDNTVTGGTVTLSGVGKWANSDTYIGGATVLNNLVDPADIPAPIDYALVWDELLGSGQSAEQELITASTNATGAQAEAIAAKNQAATNTALLQALPAPDNATILEIAKAHFNKRKWDKIGDTITIYESDGVTPFKVFDTNGDLSEITPQ